MANLLQSKVAVVTGAGAGIGEAIARAFAAEGAKVVVSDIDGDAAARVAADLVDAVAVTTNVTDEEQVKALIQRTVDEFGRLDIVVPNAGIGMAAPIVETSFDEWRRVMAVNLDGVFLTVRHALPALLESGGGSIVNISSITSLRGSPLIAGYGAAKAAVTNFTASLSAELRMQGIRANAVVPGFISTELVRSRSSDFEAALGIPAGGFDDIIAAKQTRYGTVEEVASATVFLASDLAAWCNGTTLVLDGGFTSSLL